jgi:hypothetical protein
MRGTIGARSKQPSAAQIGIKYWHSCRPTQKDTYYVSSWSLSNNSTGDFRFGTSPSSQSPFGC